MELYIIHELDNPDWKPNPHEFFYLENAIARARVVEGKTMVVYRVDDGEKVLQAITCDGNITLMSDDLIPLIRNNKLLACIRKKGDNA